VSSKAEFTKVSEIRLALLIYIDSSATEFIKLTKVVGFSRSFW